MVTESESWKKEREDFPTHPELTRLTVNEMVCYYCTVHTRMTAGAGTYRKVWQ